MPINSLTDKTDKFLEHKQLTQEKQKIWIDFY